MQTTKKLIGWLRAAAEGVVAAMLAAMFLTFVLQIFSRYIMNQPIGWTLEVCLTLWLWLVFWGCAFVVRHDEHVAVRVIEALVDHRRVRNVHVNRDPRLHRWVASTAPRATR